MTSPTHALNTSPVSPIAKSLLPAPTSRETSPFRDSQTPNHDPSEAVSRVARQVFPRKTSNNCPCHTPQKERVTPVASTPPQRGKDDLTVEDLSRIVYEQRRAAQEAARENSPPLAPPPPFNLFPHDGERELRK